MFEAGTKRPLETHTIFSKWGKWRRCSGTAHVSDFTPFSLGHNILDPLDRLLSLSQLVLSSEHRARDSLCSDSLLLFLFRWLSLPFVLKRSHLQEAFLDHPTYLPSQHLAYFILNKIYYYFSFYLLIE